MQETAGLDEGAEEVINASARKPELKLAGVFAGARNDDFFFLSSERCEAFTVLILIAIALLSHQNPSVRAARPRTPNLRADSFKNLRKPNAKIS